MISNTTAVVYASVALTGAAGVLVATVRAGREHRTEPAPTGPIPTGFRYCPTEHRTRAAVLHPDGTATCADPACGTHIPATEG